MVWVCPKEKVVRKLMESGSIFYHSDHIEKGVDFQARVRWAPKTVVLWDSKSLTHPLPLAFALPADILIPIKSNPSRPLESSFSQCVALFLCSANYDTNLFTDRVCAHSAIIDFDENFAGRRHGGRITPQAERPSLTPNGV